MAEEEASLQERVGRTASKTLYTFDQTLRDGLGSEALDQLGVVDLASYSLNSDDEVILRKWGRLCRFGHCERSTDFLS